MANAIQGLVAAGTVAYLTRDPTWEKIGLGINYLFYLMGSAGRAAHVQIPFLAFSSKAFFVLTPFILPVLIGASQQQPINKNRLWQSEHSHARESSELEEAMPMNNRVAANLSRFIYIAAAASTLVLVAFGHLAYGAAFFSIAALDMLTRQERIDQTVRKFFTGLAGIPAVLSFWSYGLNLSTTPGVQLMVLITVEVFFPRIYNLFSPGRSSYGGGWYYYPRPSSRSEESEPTTTTQPSTGKKFPEISKLMGPLPHGL